MSKVHSALQRMTVTAAYVRADRALAKLVPALRDAILAYDSLAETAQDAPCEALERLRLAHTLRDDLAVLGASLASAGLVCGLVPPDGSPRTAGHGGVVGSSAAASAQPDGAHAQNFFLPPVTHNGTVAHGA